MFSAGYVAGLFDGEGCVSIFAHRVAVKCRAQYSWRLTVSFGMVHRPVIERLHRQFGGSVRINESKDTVRRRSFQWKVGGNGAASFLLFIQRDAFIKRDEIDFALQYWNDPEIRITKGASKRMTDAEFSAYQAKHQWYREKLTAMKKVEYSSAWDSGEFGEQPMPGHENGADGQPRTKQTGLQLVGRA